MADIVLDIETLGVRPDTVVLTIGAVRFNTQGGGVDVSNGLHIKLDVDEQTAMGRHISEDTLSWWATQPPEVREDALSEEGRLPVVTALQELNRFLVGSNDIWAQGPVFDITILENLYRQMGIPAPWHFWNIRDSRTLFGVHGDPRDKNRKGAHNALMDCYYQAKAIQEVFKRADIKPLKYYSSNYKTCK